jgi:hypothetical protein
MSIVITMGLGNPGGGALSTLVTTMGYGGTVLGACAAFQALGVQPFDDHLVVSFNDTFAATGPANLASGFTIEVIGPGDPVSVLSVSNDGSNRQTTLFTTIHTFGAHYRLHLPHVGYISTDGRALSGPFELDYTGGSGSPVAVQLIRALDARIIEIVFARRVNQEDAENIANYSISPALKLFSSQKVTDFHYRLITDQQVIDQLYNVTITNIRGA